MDKTDKRALVLALIDALNSAGSWSGETHVQKVCYVLQTLFNFPTDFEFILYKHGPFSFSLQEYLTELRGDDLLAAFSTLPSGMTLRVSQQGKKVESMRQTLVSKYAESLKLVSSQLGVKRVKDLEKTATAIFVTKELGNDVPSDVRAQRITEYKTHVNLEEAQQAISEADNLFKVASGCAR